MSATVASAIALLALAAAVSVPPRGWASTTPPTLRLAAFGPFFALQLLFLQNPAALASQAGLSLPMAAGTVLRSMPSRSRPGAWGCGSDRSSRALTALAAVDGYLLVDASGPGSVLAVGAEQVMLVLLLARALIPSRPDRCDRVASRHRAHWGRSCSSPWCSPTRLPSRCPALLQRFRPSRRGAIEDVGPPETGTIATGSARAAAVPLVLLAVPALVVSAGPSFRPTRR
jgi:hypothetical protein